MGDKKHTLLGIAYECPFYERLHNCPVGSIEQDSIYEKYDFLNNLDEEYLVSFSSHHKKCSNQREEHIRNQ